ncbi:hypothetical protein GGX14DRAFT_480568, partial [Mycena pura]
MPAARLSMPAARHSLPARSLSVGSRPAFAAHTARDTYSTPVSTRRARPHTTTCAVQPVPPVYCEQQTPQRPPPPTCIAQYALVTTAHDTHAARRCAPAGRYPLPASPASRRPPSALYPEEHTIPDFSRPPPTPARHTRAAVARPTPATRARAPPHAAATSNTCHAAAHARVPGFCIGPAPAVRCPMTCACRPLPAARESVQRQRGSNSSMGDISVQRAAGSVRARRECS